MADIDQRCHHLRQMISDTQERHARELAPLFDALARLEACRSPRPMLISREQAERIGIEITTNQQADKAGEPKQ